MDEPQPNFYVTGGTLQRDAPSYIQRKADTDLYNGLSIGNFCYVLTSRQMGKSSLMVRTAMRLRAEGVAVAVLDLTAIGQNVTVEQWYDGLLARVGQQLHLEDELEDFWLDKGRLGPLQRWVQALRELVLNRCKGRVVIFIDEIDSVRSLPFSTDEFFAGIRELYNRRTEDAALQRLSFCLLGVATPSDLIKDTRTTPFNIGQRIELTDFTEAEAGRLTEGLGRTQKLGAHLLKRILYWTAGHPYLMQRLCQAVAQDQSVRGKSGVDRICEELFLSSQAREKDDNLLFVRDRILRAEVDRAGLLELYAQVRNHKRVPNDEANPLFSVLRLSGITRVVEGYLYLRNRIYYRVFDQEWVRTNMPDAELRRQQAAYKRGFISAASGAGAFQIGLACLVLWLGLSLANFPLKDNNGAFTEYPYGLVTSFEQSGLDVLFQLRDVLHPELRERGLREPITLIEVDEESIRESDIRPQKWPRSYYARLIDRATAGGASVIGLDIYLSGVGGKSDYDKADDQKILESLTNASVVLVKNLPLGGSSAIDPLPVFAEQASGIGFADTPHDADRVVRTAQIFNPRQRDDFSFAATLAQIHTHESLQPIGDSLEAVSLGQRIIPLRPDTSINIDYRTRTPGFRRISARDILFRDNENISDEEYFRDRIVLIGATNNDAPDLFATPYYQPGLIATTTARILGRNLETAPKLMPGIEVHANIVSTMLFGKHLVRHHYLWRVIMLGLSLALAALALIWLRFLLGVVAVLLIMLTALVISTWLFNTHGVILPLWSMCLGTGLLAFVGFILGLSSRMKISFIKPPKL